MKKSKTISLVAIVAVLVAATIYVVKKIKNQFNVDEEPIGI